MKKNKDIKKESYYKITHDVCAKCLTRNKNKCAGDKICLNHPNNKKGD